MIKMINKLTGTEMFVDESRLEEYLAAGHKEVKSSAPKKEAAAPKKAPEAPKESPVSKVKKTVAKVTKTARKKG